jgi:putative SOS response-associated peptidase YedK
MCGRYSLTTTIDQLLPRVKGPLPEGFLEHYQPRKQVRPGELLLIQQQQQGTPEVPYARWGLVPSWLKDTRGKSLPIHDRMPVVIMDGWEEALLRTEAPAELWSLEALMAPWDPAGRDLSGKLSARGAELSTEMDCTAS